MACGGPPEAFVRFAGRMAITGTFDQAAALEATVTSLEEAAALQSSNFWMKKRADGTADLYTVNSALLEEDPAKPGSYIETGAGYRALAAEILRDEEFSELDSIDKKEHMGVKGHAHWSARIDDTGGERAWIIDRLHRAPGVAGRINSPQGY